MTIKKRLTLSDNSIIEKDLTIEEITAIRLGIDTQKYLEYRPMLVKSKYISSFYFKIIDMQNITK